jgi:hypothetical protein
MVMQKIIVNGRETAIEDFISLFEHDDEFDADGFGACFDTGFFDMAMFSFDEAYTTFELVEKYLQLADKPIEVTI